jgi:hypothetical protein
MCPGRGMADAGAPNAPHPRLTELAALDQGARVALVHEISAKGFEPGCWIRVDDGELIDAAIARQLMVETLGAVEKLPPGALAGLDA